MIARTREHQHSQPTLRAMAADVLKMHHLFDANETRDVEVPETARNKENSMISTNSLLPPRIAQA